MNGAALAGQGEDAAITNLTGRPARLQTLLRARNEDDEQKESH
jgi:hypothetical protein